MCHFCERTKLANRAEAILADVEGGYEMNRPEIARLIRDMSADIRAQNNLGILSAIALGRDPHQAVPALSLALGVPIDAK